MKKIICFICSCLLLTSSALATDILGASNILLRSATAQGYRCAELSLGSFAADALREAYGSDFAIWCVGELKQNLLPGDITYKTLEQCIRYDRETIAVQVTAVQLKALLEELFSHLVLNEKEQIDLAQSDFDGYPEISGFQVRCDVSESTGSRILSIYLEDGQELDLNDSSVLYSLSGSVELLSGIYGSADLTSLMWKSLPKTQQEIVADYISSTGTISSEPSTGRISIIGAREHNLLGDIPPVFIVGVVVMISICFVPKLRFIFKCIKQPGRWR